MRRRGLLVTWTLLWLTLALGHVTLAEDHVFAVEDGDALLPCSGSGGTKVTFQWTRLSDSRSIIQISNSGMSRYGMGYDQSKVKTTDFAKGNYSLKISKIKFTDAGHYKCSSGPTVVQLHIIQVASSDGSTFLQSGNVILTCTIIPDLSGESRTWLNSKKETVTNSKRHMLPQDGKVLEIKQLQPQDSGSWTCRVRNIDASYKLDIVGVSDNDQVGPIYTTVNQSVVLPFVLTHNIRMLPKIGSVELTSGTISRSHEKGVTQVELTSLNVSLWKESSDHRITTFPDGSLSVYLSSVSFQDAGWYRFSLTFNKGMLQKELQLVIVEVTASPKSEVSIDDQVNLTCRVSSATPSSKLTWFHVNNTRITSESKGGAKDLTFQIPKVTADHFGLWRCKLEDGGQVKINAEYKLEKKNSPYLGIGGMPYWILLAVGGAILLLLIIIIGVIILCCTARRRRRRARRRSMMKRPLNPQRTCQCHKVPYELYRP